MNHTTIAAIAAVAIALIGGVNHLPSLAIAQIMKLPFGSQGQIGSTLSNAQDTPLTMHASSSGDNGGGGHPGGGRHPGIGGGGPTSDKIGRNIPVYAITIPFSSEGQSTFDPKEISIPTGMITENIPLPQIALILHRKQSIQE